jgi:hypothetical protein
VTDPHLNAEVTHLTRHREDIIKRLLGKCLVSFGIDMLDVEHDKICDLHELEKLVVPLGICIIRVAGSIEACVYALCLSLGKKLEKEIDMSDVQTIPYDSIHSVFMPYGMAICLEKSNTIRIQPWVPDQIGQRYYNRASQAKAIFKLRMLNRWQISLDDANRALEIMKEKNPNRADCLKIDLTKC